MAHCHGRLRRKLLCMTVRAPDPRRLDVAAAAAAGVALAGRWPLSDLGRLADGAAGEVDEPVAWSARFEQRREHGGAPQACLHLQAHARVARECQRCLQPVLLVLDVDRAFCFAPNEDEAAALDADSEDDVLVLSRQFDLRELVEDELLLSLPIVPKHEQCPAPLESAAPSQAGQAPTPEHPFAALASLRRGRGP
jgi:uncharacterized protein